MELLAALGAGVTLAGCGQSAEVPSAGSAATPQPAASAAPQYDISRVAAFTDAQVDPPQCRSVVIPPYVDPKLGTDAAGVIAQGDQGNMYVVALKAPAPVAAGENPAGCDRVALSGSPQATGTVERIPAPDIAGATTTGARLTVADPQEDPDYLYTAALDDRTSIVVMGSADTALDPQRLMGDLLVKAVSAVRGQ